MSDPLFDLSQEYDEMLNKGVSLSGESKEFFMEGRVRDMTNQLARDFKPERILDFGCGIGGTTEHLAEVFPNAIIVGTDTAGRALEYAKDHSKSARTQFIPLESFCDEEAYDLCYTNGVFHHIEPPNRSESLKIIHRALKKRGYFALFENNPWNIGTRAVMSRIPFDRDARVISPPEAEQMLVRHGFSKVVSKRSLFYFPRFLSFLRVMEPALASLPLGAQYLILTQKTT